MGRGNGVLSVVVVMSHAKCGVIPRGDDLSLPAHGHTNSADSAPQRQSTHTCSAATFSLSHEATHRLLDLITHRVENDRKVSPQDK